MKPFFLFALISLTVLAPTMVHAAVLQMVPSPATEGQEFSVRVQLLPEGEALNAVEGNIHIPEDLQVTRISTGGSALTLWPAQPAFSHASGEISFAGGTPDVLSSGASAQLFTIYLKGDTQGSYKITPEDIAVFRADGTGTRISASAPVVSIALGTEVVPAENLTDRSAPYDVTAAIGTDPSLFDGAPFVYVYGRDEGTGIASYQVKDGWFARYQTVGQYYVLTAPQNTQPIWVRAVDGVGNIRAVHVPHTGGVLYYGVFVLAALLMILLVLLAVRYRKRLIS
ncbi:MAG: hypothetical protein AB203_02240 [Parcubacteria bacterium C7867-008]|nr:MAG: hypothetical protein AB203_02240 [Parcubacteria bacterium C7867-008]